MCILNESIVNTPFAPPPPHANKRIKNLNFSRVSDPHSISTYTIIHTIHIWLLIRVLKKLRTTAQKLFPIYKDYYSFGR